MNAGDILRVEVTSLSETCGDNELQVVCSAHMVKTEDKETTVSPGTQYYLTSLSEKMGATLGDEIFGTAPVDEQWAAQVYRDGEWIVPTEIKREVDNIYISEIRDFVHPSIALWQRNTEFDKNKTVLRMLPYQGANVALAFTAPETGRYTFDEIPVSHTPAYDMSSIFDNVGSKEAGLRITVNGVKIWPEEGEWVSVVNGTPVDVPTIKDILMNQGDILRLECTCLEGANAANEVVVVGSAHMIYQSPLITSDVNTIDRTNNTVTVDPGKVSDVIAGFDAHGYELKVFNGETEVGADQAVASGMTLKLFVYGTAYDTLTLTVRPEYVVTEKYLDEDGNEAQASTSTSVIEGSAYSKTAPTIDNYTYVGYKINGGDLQQGDPSIAAVSASTEVTFVYRDKRIATLSALSVDGYTLTPDFAADTTEYTVSVPNSVTSVTITATPKSAQANAVVDGKTSDLEVGQNTATVTVTAEDGTTTKEYTIVITREAPVAVTGVTLNKSETTLVVGGEETLTATVAPDNATDKTVTWESSDPTVATVENGKITALKVGTTTITVKTTDGEFTATCTVTANPVAVTGVTLNKSETTLVVGGEETLTATVAPDNATDKTVTWESSDPTVATVENGKITALKVGTTTITVKTTDGEFTATCTVTANPVAVTGVTLNKSETTLVVGGEETLTATVAPDNATDKTVTWESSDPTVATVENGKITALKAGTTTITVKTADGEFTATCVVTVEEEPGEPSDTTGSSDTTTTDTTTTDTTATTDDTDDTTAGTTTGTTVAGEEDVEGGKTGHAAPFAVLGLALSAGLALVLTRRNRKKAD